MTEQYTPSDYDLHVQNPRIDQLESLITAEYQPPAGVEYSFPVANQGITQEQFRLMFLGQANGIIHGDNGVVNDNPNSTGWRYYLDNHESDAETNQRNTKILRAGTSAESIVEGFYHRLTEDMELPFPPVTTTTVYHVTITYDPRDFKTHPVKIQVYPGEPPTSHGRVHLLLYTLERHPNQLLTQATVTRYRPYTAGLLSVQNRNQLPDPSEYPAGTVVVPSANGHGIYVRQNGGHVWLDPISHKADKPGPWKNLTLFSGWSDTASGARTPMYRRTSLGVQLRGRVAKGSGAGNAMVQFPPGDVALGSTFRAPVSLDTDVVGQISVRPHVGEGRTVAVSSIGASGYVQLDGIIIPDSLLA